MVMAFS